MIKLLQLNILLNFNSVICIIISWFIIYSINYISKITDRQIRLLSLLYVYFILINYRVSELKLTFVFSFAESVFVLLAWKFSSSTCSISLHFVVNLVQDNFEPNTETIMLCVLFLNCFETVLKLTNVPLFYCLQFGAQYKDHLLLISVLNCFETISNTRGALNFFLWVCAARVSESRV